jgi:predicted secreted protein
MNLPINFKKGYEMFGKEYEACLKANKYLAKQYKRMAKALADGDMVKYTAIFKTLRNKSD